MPRGRPNAPAGRVVLSLNGGPTDSLVVRLGCQLAQAVETELVAVYVVEVDWRHDLDDDLVESREQASRVLDLAEGVAERARVPMRSQLLQARDVGAAVVDEAAALDAEAIILGLPYKVRFGGDFAIGPTILHVLKNAPCRVHVVREPMADSDVRVAGSRKD